jgi:hypothetical protein
MPSTPNSHLELYLTAGIDPEQTGEAWSILVEKEHRSIVLCEDI